MRISRKNLLASLTLVFGLILNNVSLAQSVEYGQDATGDPNAVWVMGASGFLYSDRIVFTAAHVIDVLGDKFVNEAYLFAPGVKSGPDQKRYFVQKVNDIHGFIYEIDKNVYETIKTNPYWLSEIINWRISGPLNEVYNDTGLLIDKGVINSNRATIAATSKTLKNILPSRIFEKLIMNHYKL